MRQSLRLGRIAGIPVGAHWSALGITAVIVAVLGSAVLPQAVPGQDAAWYWIAALATGSLFMLSLLAHEIAHALVARRRGLAVSSVTLWFLGGATELAEEPATPGTELRMAAAGPLTSLALAGASLLALILASPSGLVAAALAWLTVMNALLGAFNLLPGLPLDGGRVLHAVLWRALRDRERAGRVASQAGFALGAGMVVLGLLGALVWSWGGGLWLALTGWFIAGSARQEWRSGLDREALRPLRVRDVMTPAPDLAPGWMTVHEFAAAVALRSRQLAFPVVGFDGRPSGVISLHTLTGQRAEARVDQVARPLPLVLAPGDEATRLLDASMIVESLVALVVDGGHVVGMVALSDLVRVREQAALRAPDTGGAASLPR